jgi:cytochrome c-type biogenesis protein CcmH/NrfG
VGDKDDEIIHLRIATEKDPANAWWFFYLGNALSCRDEDQEDCELAYLDAVKVRPDFAEVWAQLGHI